MSLYNMLFGSNPQADVILATLDLSKTDVGRFRDAYVANGEIAVYTRNGGGNRECWNDDPTSSEDCTCPGCTINYLLPKHPCYLRDEDDDFDCTYATVYFRFPENYAAGLTALDSGEAWDPDKRWLDMIDSLKVGS